MKKLLISLFIVGLLLGIGQLFLVRDITKQKVTKMPTPDAEIVCLAIAPECGHCDYQVKDGHCYSKPYTQKVKGFPFTSGAYGHDSRINTTPTLILNVFIIAGLLPALGYVAVKASKKLHA